MISSATSMTKSVLVAALAIGPPLQRRADEGVRLYIVRVRRLLLIWRRRRPLVLHVLLHSLLVLGHQVGHFRFLVRGQQLVNLRRDLGVLDFHLDVSLRFL